MKPIEISTTAEAHLVRELLAAVRRGIAGASLASGKVQQRAIEHVQQKIHAELTRAGLDQAAVDRVERKALGLD